MNRVKEKSCRSEINQGHKDHKKVKCELNQGLVMIKLYVKFDVNSSNAKQDNAKQAIVLKIAERRTTEQT